MDPVRQKIFIDTLTAAEKKYFGHELGKKRLVLADLSADPRYHRRGAGRALMQWGLEKAREHHVPITLTSSPLGRYLYTNVGFKELAYVDCGVEGVEERPGVWVMVWFPEGWEQESITQS
jgi:predicted N-acetyltransferase YhbS